MNSNTSNFLDIRSHGFFRVAAVTPLVALGNPKENGRTILVLLRKLYQQGAMYVLFPELCMTGYSNLDAFYSHVLISSAEEALAEMLKKTKRMNVIFSVGIPVRVNGSLYNCAVTCAKGNILAIVPKAHTVDYGPFDERRHYARASEARVNGAVLCGQTAPFGTEILIHSAAYPDFVLHTDVCEDGLVPVDKSGFAALAGATVLANLSASNAEIGKAAWRRMIMQAQSSRYQAVRMYASAGSGESTTEVTWDGHLMVCERGSVLAERDLTMRNVEDFFGSDSIVVDIHLATITQDRAQQNTRVQNASDVLERDMFRHISFDGTLGCGRSSRVYHTFRRSFSQTPFVPEDTVLRDQVCQQALTYGLSALVTRLKSLPSTLQKVIVAISGGRDSTKALLIAYRTMQVLGLPLTNVIAITMPGLGTTDGTLTCARDLAKALGVTFRECSITNLADQVFSLLDHDPAIENLTFENVQAWLRKLISVASAGKDGGIELCTGDLSEAQIGYCTYLADQTGHFAVNAGEPKALIEAEIRYISAHWFASDKAVQNALQTGLEIEISAELRRPNTDGSISQVTEEEVGPQDLRDFFGYWLQRFWLSPYTITRLALEAFGNRYDVATHKHWLKVFLMRFFQNQFKRTGMPSGGIRVGTVSVSPRRSLRLPDEIALEPWIRDLERAPDSLG